MSAGIVFHSLAALAYAILAISLWRPLTLGGAQAHAGKVGRICLLSAIVLHGIALHQSILLDNSLRLSWALGMSAAIWVGMIIFWLESLILRIDGLLLILLPAVTLVSTVAAAFPQGYIVAHAHNDWLRAHLLIALTAQGLSAIAALHAILMIALDRHLRFVLKSTEPRALDAHMKILAFTTLVTALLFSLGLVLAI